MDTIKQTTLLVLDKGEILEFFGNKINELSKELDEVSSGEWSADFGLQYDNEYLSIIMQGQIFETGLECEAPDYFVRESIDIIGVTFNCYYDGEEIERFLVNGMDEKTIINELYKYL